MNIRFFNHTKLEDDHAMPIVKHWYRILKNKDVECITLENDKVTFFGIDCVLGEFYLNKDVKVKGKIRWFNESSGEGKIRLKNGQSIHFYSCNVEGANSLYPELTNNIHFTEGQNVEATYSADKYTLQALGLINVKAAS